jgi:hypothetical protein
MKVAATAVAGLLAVPLLVVAAVGSLLGGLGGSLGPTETVGAARPPAAIVALDEAVAAAPRTLVPCSVPAQLLLAQQQIESGYDPTAVSDAGAEGLAQFEPPTFVEYASPVPPGGVVPPTPFDPTDAAYAEARFLCAHGYTASPAAALISYNCGSISPACITASSGYAAEILSLAARIELPPAPTRPSS